MRFLLAALVAVLFCAVVPLVPVPQAAAQGETPTQLDVIKITPSVVGVGSPGEVVVTGRLTNTTDHQINNVEARIQRGNATSAEPAVQRALREDPATVTEPAFTSVATRLAPGQQIPVELHIPLTGANSLQISQPGVYPLLVNVNGAPSGGGRARIAQAQFLLPVLAPPGGTQLRPEKPTETSMLVPLVDYPRLEREAIGGMRAVLADDQLSTSLAPGGRLYDLVQAVSDRVTPGSPLGSALCFAVDPDLLITVQSMQRGYLVRQPNGSLVEGIGAGAADLWLSKLRQATSGRCVIALPYADADIVALGRAGLPDLVDGALDGTDLVRNILRVEPRNVLWPIEGVLADPAIGQKMPHTALLEPRALNIPAGSLTPVRVRNRDMSAVPVDPLLTSALDPQHDTEQTVTALSPPQNGLLSVQDTLGALAFRATQAQVPGATSVLAPPRRWNLRGDDLRALLDGMQQLADAGLIRPTPMPDPTPNSLPQADLDYPVDAGSAEISQPVLSELAAQNFKVGDLYGSIREERSSTVRKGDITTPLRNGLLHGASSAWRGNPEAARRWVDRTTLTIDDVLSQVHIEEFAGQVTRMDTATSPIPLTVVNDLPITVVVVFRIPRVPGVEIKQDFDGPVTIPANSRRGFQLPATTQRAGKFTIDVTLTTQSGTQFGTTKRMQLESNNFGALIPILTGSAAALLVLMSGLRIAKRALARRRRRAAGSTDPAADSSRPWNPAEPDAEPGTASTGTAATNGAQQDSTPGTAQIATTDSDRNRN
ncbi:DUF6049 family protein [Saccharopolyspora sp. NPDC000995]